MSKNFVGAFQCSKCPKSNDPSDERACPAWWEITFQNNQTGEVAQERACAWVLMPKFLLEVIKASNRPAAEIAKMTNSILLGLEKLEPPNGQFTPQPAFGPHISTDSLLAFEGHERGASPPLSGGE